jgi:phosphoglycolate phosphatase
MITALFDLDGTLTDGVDMRAARHHGLHALGALWGYGSREELVAQGACALCASPAEVATAARQRLEATG